MNDVQKMFKNMVSMFISADDNLTEEIIDSKVDEVKGLPTFRILTHDEIEEVRASLKSEYSIKLDTGVLIEEKGHQRWFLAKKASLEMRYWERYRNYLIADKGFSVNVVNKMDDVLDTLTDLLGDPTRDISYSRRGLIIGDVQSGKTANYTGLICKGVDAGYKVIVLLTGTIEKLRQQTQQRIDEGFVGASSVAIMKQQEDQLVVGVGKYDPSVRPMVLTSVADDFKQKNATNLGFNLRNINGPVIFVVKKNVAVLKRLNKWLKTFNQNGEQAINHSLLVVDDESDNASVNTKADPDDSPTAINKEIRMLLKMFTKSSYVGLTATPFANIFIDPDSFDDMVKEDLFPKDYIYSLNAPSNYVGARNIFGEDGDAQNMLIEINDYDLDPNSIAYILPLKHKSSHVIQTLPGDLKTAIEAFLLANTIEDLRGMKNNHRSMLINVSRFTAVQDHIAVLINGYLKDLQAACKNYAMLPVESALSSVYIANLKQTYETVYSDAGFEWETVQHMLYSSCAGIVVQTFNINAGQNVNYDNYPQGFRVIAVGGMSLSRGLTLEGLVVSYFYRNSKMYDTLMQMGRWFGYRTGYADLCRIWMSSESIEWYRHISQATDELREEIKRYEDTGLTPLDFGLRVRSDINTLLITARNKMRSAESRECAISLSGVCIETPEIYSSEEKNTKNFESVRKLVQTLEENNCERIEIKGRSGNGSKYGYKGVPSHIILEFLENLQISPKNEQFNVSTVTKFIRDYRGIELKKWDVAFASGAADLSVDLGYGIKYNGLSRQFSVVNDGKILKMSGSKRRLGTSSDGKFGLSEEKARLVREREKTNNPAQKAYFENVSRDPLLTIYVVKLDKGFVGSNAGEEERIAALQSAEDFLGRTVLGFGIGIPTLADQETKYARYVLNKVAIQNMFEGEMDEWDPEEDD